VKTKRTRDRWRSLSHTSFAFDRNLQRPRQCHYLTTIRTNRYHPAEHLTTPPTARTKSLVVDLRTELEIRRRTVLLNNEGRQDFQINLCTELVICRLVLDWDGGATRPCDCDVFIPHDRKTHFWSPRSDQWHCAGWHQAKGVVHYKCGGHEVMQSRTDQRLSF